VQESALRWVGPRSDRDLECSGCTDADQSSTMLALAWRKCRCFEAVKLGSVAGLFANMEDYVRIASGGARNHRRVDMRREHS
jgi:hypothetical protein